MILLTFAAKPYNLIRKHTHLFLNLLGLVRSSIPFLKPSFLSSDTIFKTLRLASEEICFSEPEIKAGPRPPGGQWCLLVSDFLLQTPSSCGLPGRCPPHLLPPSRRVREREAVENLELLVLTDTLSSLLF